MDEATQKNIEKLNKRLFLFPSQRKVGAARKLIGTREPEAVAPLIHALKDKSERVRESAQLALESLSGSAINCFCALWAESRDEELESVILKCRYVASDPPQLTALTSFLQGRKPEIQLTEEIIHACLADAQEIIVQNTIDFLLAERRMSYDALWTFSIEHPESSVPRYLDRKGWHPDDPSQRALFYFLARDFDRYHDLDFEQSHLRYWYETGSPLLKEAIASRIRESGDTRLLSVFRTERGGRKEKLSEKEVELQIGILEKNGNYSDLFALLRYTTFEQGVRILTILREAGWKSPDHLGRELQTRLESLLEKSSEEKAPSYAMDIYQDFRPMFLGNETPPWDEASLWAWTEDGNSFRRRSTALITLAEKGSPKLSDAANRACNDPYWQVRMAAAAAEVLRPGTLSTANKAILEQDHVYWVQALLKMPANRLADLGPKGLDELRQIRISDPRHKPQDADNFFDLIKGFIPTQEREYLLTLGEFLVTDIVVSEETSYGAGETDVEIEMEE